MPLQRFPAAFSVDLEDYYHPELIRRHAAPGACAPRVAESTAPILDLLDRHGVKATFFVVGEVCRSAPALIQRIVDAGHEIGCHTHTHLPLWEMTPDSFRQELDDFKAALKDAVGDVPVRGFRAPTFSVDGSTAWALKVLSEAGFTYDSSIVPIKGPLYGCPGAPLAMYRPALADITKSDAGASLVEFPAPIAQVAGASVPVGGGFYLRVMPFAMYLHLVRRVLKVRPFFLYVHPWETDVGTPRFRLPGFARWATYTGLKRTLSKLERLLKLIEFTTMRNTLEASGFGV